MGILVGVTAGAACYRTEWNERWLGYKRLVTKHAEGLRNAKRVFEDGTVGVGDDVTEEVDGLTEAMESLSLVVPEDEVQPRMLEALRSQVQIECVVTYLIIEHKKTLEKEDRLLLLVFLDALGRVVRSKRVCASEAEQMGGFWLEEAWSEIAEWEHGETGSDYERDGAWEALLNHGGQI